MSEGMKCVGEGSAWVKEGSAWVAKRKSKFTNERFSERMN